MTRILLTVLNFTYQNIQKRFSLKYHYYRHVVKSYTKKAQKKMKNKLTVDYNVYISSINNYITIHDDKNNRYNCRIR